MGQKPARRERAEESREALKLISQWDRIQEDNGVLYRKTTGSDGRERRQLLLPTRLRRDLLEGNHDLCGHQGAERTEQLIHNCCWWPGMHREVKQYVSKCERCAIAKGPGQRPITPKGMASVSVTNGHFMTCFAPSHLSRSAGGQSTSRNSAMCTTPHPTLPRVIPLTI